MSKKVKYVYGFGVNDSKTKVQIKKEMPKINGKRVQKLIWTCPYYLKWKEMLRRCFDQVWLINNPTYRDCTVCDEWKYLSNFIKWVDSQPNKDWRVCQLDKDILVRGNKHYSPETVVFIKRELNTFLTDSSAARGSYLIGCHWSKSVGRFAGQCGNPWGATPSEKSGHLGYFDTELEAHLAWKAKKHEYACKWADLETNPLVASALRELYL